VLKRAFAQFPDLGDGRISGIDEDVGDNGRFSSLWRRPGDAAAEGQR
jgi:hypothetical protein